MNLSTTYVDIIEIIKKRETEIRTSYQFTIDRLHEKIAELYKRIYKEVTK